MSDDTIRTSGNRFEDRTPLIVTVEIDRGALAALKDHPATLWPDSNGSHYVRAVRRGVAALAAAVEIHPDMGTGADVSGVPADGPAPHGVWTLKKQSGHLPDEEIRLQLASENYPEQELLVIWPADDDPSAHIVHTTDRLESLDGTTSQVVCGECAGPAMPDITCVHDAPVETEVVTRAMLEEWLDAIDAGATTPGDIRAELGW